MGLPLLSQILCILWGRGSSCVLIPSFLVGWFAFVAVLGAITLQNTIWFQSLSGNNACYIESHNCLYHERQVISKHSTTLNIIVWLKKVEKAKQWIDFFYQPHENFQQKCRNLVGINFVNSLELWAAIPNNQITIILLNSRYENSKFPIMLDFLTNKIRGYSQCVWHHLWQCHPTQSSFQDHAWTRMSHEKLSHKF